MCLICLRTSPLVGLYNPSFNSKGYVTCWKVYAVHRDGLYPIFKHSDERIDPGFIWSDREIQKAGEDAYDEDIDASYAYSGAAQYQITKGIHMFVSIETAPCS